MEFEQSPAKKPRIDQSSFELITEAPVPAANPLPNLASVPPAGQQSGNAHHVDAFENTVEAAVTVKQAKGRKITGEGSGGWEMAPWEQHSAVINLARFDYRGGEALLEGRSGFLITCGFRREKSATSEAMALLPKYLQRCLNTAGSSVPGEKDEGEHRQRTPQPKTADQEVVGPRASSVAAVEQGGEAGERPLAEAEAGLASGAEEAGGARCPTGGPPGAQDEGTRVAHTATPHGQHSGRGDPRTGMREWRGNEEPPLAETSILKTGSEPPPTAGKRQKRRWNGSTAPAAEGTPERKDKSGNGQGSGVKSRDSEKAAEGEAGGEGEAGAEPGLPTVLSLVKLGCMGVVFAALAPTFLPSPVELVARLLDDIRTQQQTPLKWCQRMVPVQATCPPMLEAVQPLVRRLVKEHVERTAGTTPPRMALKFAVAYKRRGPETEENGKKNSTGGGGGKQAQTKAPSELAPERETRDGSHGLTSCTASSSIGDLEKGTCVAAIAAAVEEAAGEREAQVDLSSPEIVVAVEILPLPQAKAVCAVSVLPASLCDVKPRLAVKSLARSK